MPQSASIVLCGPNGVGKTNILEALSLFSSGRGMRSAKLSDFRHFSAKNPLWGVSAHIDGPSGDHQVSTGADPENPMAERRIIKVDGNVLKNQAGLNRFASVIWLTPQMDRLFSENKSEKRRFFDRLVALFDYDHTARLYKYEALTRERMKILKTSGGTAQASWLSSVEAKIVEVGIALAASRQDLIEKINQAQNEVKGAFPSVSLSLTGQLEAWLSEKTSLQAEDSYAEALQRTRSEDQQSGRTSVGPNRTDFRAVFVEKEIGAHLCSTGEQKALLISIMFSAVRLMTKLGSGTPVLLLDEIAAHLDEKRCADLFDEVKKTGAQAWYTGTDREIFSSLFSDSDVFDVQSGALCKV